MTFFKTVNDNKFEIFILVNEISEVFVTKFSNQLIMHFQYFKGTFLCHGVSAKD